MSEAIWCSVTFRYPPTWEVDGQPAPFVTLAGEALINGDMNPDTEFVDGKHVEVPGVWQCHGEGNYGWNDDDFAAVIEWCHQHRVPYVGTEEGGPDWSGVIHVYDGFHDTEWQLGYDGQTAALDEGTYKKIIAGESAFDSVEHYFALGNADVRSFSIEHLPAEYPEEDE